MSPLFCTATAAAMDTAPQRLVLVLPGCYRTVSCLTNALDCR